MDSGFSYEVKTSFEFSTSPRASACTCSEMGLISAELANSGLLFDDASRDIAGKVRIRTETIIKKFSSFCLLGELINFCTEIAPLSNRDEF